jgi:hypothetical protein
MKAILFCGGYDPGMRDSGGDGMPKPMQMVGPRPLMHNALGFEAAWTIPDGAAEPYKEYIWAGLTAEDFAKKFTRLRHLEPLCARGVLALRLTGLGIVHEGSAASRRTDIIVENVCVEGPSEEAAVDPERLRDEDEHIREVRRFNAHREMLP